MQINGTAITIHGREGLYLPYARKTVDAQGVHTQIDISGSSLFFEVDGILRKRLIADPDDALGQAIELTLVEVDALKASTTKWAVIDETGELPAVQLEGTIKRIGWTEVPPNV
jgi:hypothetical protein